MANFGGGLVSFLAFIPNPIISANEAWFMSNTQKVHWLFTKLCEVIKKVNTYDELFAELKDILLEFDETVREEVEKYIKQMYEDGDLEDILAQVTNEYLASLGLTPESFSTPKSGKLNMVRVMRDIYEYWGSTASTVTNPSVGVPFYVQGGVIYEHQGNRRMAGVYETNFNGDSYNVYSNTKRLVGYDSLEDLSTRRISNQTYNLGHGNGMTYNPDDGFFYIAPSTRYITDGAKAREQDHHIYRISRDFGTRESIEIQNLRTTDIAYYNGNLYIINDNDHYNMSIYTLDWANESVTLVGHIEPTMAQEYYNFDISDGKLFMLASDSRNIDVFELESGEHLWTYNFDAVSSDFYKLSEPEFISVFDDGDIYIGTSGYDGFRTATSCGKMEIFKMNYKTNSVEIENDEQFVNEPAGATVNVLQHYAGGKNLPQVLAGLHTSGTNTIPELRCQIANPNGSSTAPFETMAEAFEYINNNPYITHCKVWVYQGHRVPTFASCNKSVEICGRTFANKNGNIYNYVANDKYTVGRSGVKSYLFDNTNSCYPWNNVEGVYPHTGGLMGESFVRAQISGLNFWAGSQNYHIKGGSGGSLALYGCNVSVYECRTHKSPGSYPGLFYTGANTMATHYGVTVCDRASRNSFGTIHNEGQDDQYFDYSIAESGICIEDQHGIIFGKYIADIGSVVLSYE